MSPNRHSVLRRGQIQSISNRQKNFYLLSYKTVRRGEGGGLFRFSYDTNTSQLAPTTPPTFRPSKRNRKKERDRASSLSSSGSGEGKYNFFLSLCTPPRPCHPKKWSLFRGLSVVCDSAKLLPSVCQIFCCCCWPRFRLLSIGAEGYHCEGCGKNMNFPFAFFLLYVRPPEVALSCAMSFFYMNFSLSLS